MRNKYIGAIIGTAIGDALGAPMETMTAEEIAKEFPNFDQNRHYVSRKNRKAGQWTDDTQLTIATSSSIIENFCIHPPDIAKRYAAIKSRRGWGRSTIKAIDQIAKGVPWYEASNDCLGIGNGAAMKAAPLGIILKTSQHGTSAAHCLNSIIDVCKITHKDIGIRAGFLQSLLINYALSSESDAKTIIIDLKLFEAEYFNKSILADKMGLLHGSIKRICEDGGISSKAIESWPTTAAIYLKILNNEIDPIDALFKLIKQGGDCDTTGAMLGCLIGAKFGYEIFPKKLVGDLEDSKFLINLSEQLYERFRS